MGAVRKAPTYQGERYSGGDEPKDAELMVYADIHFPAEKKPEALQRVGYGRETSYYSNAVQYRDERSLLQDGAMILASFAFLAIVFLFCSGKPKAASGDVVAQTNE